MMSMANTMKNMDTSGMSNCRNSSVLSKTFQQLETIVEVMVLKTTCTRNKVPTKKPPPSSFTQKLVNRVYHHLLSSPAVTIIFLAKAKNETTTKRGQRL